LLPDPINDLGDLTQGQLLGTRDGDGFVQAAVVVFEALE